MLQLTINLIIQSLIILIITTVVVYLLTPYIIKYLKRKGIVGIDVHKPDKPEIPERGGIVIFGGFTIGIIICILLFSDLWLELMIYWSVVTIATTIGVIDDIKQLGPITKPVLLLFAAIPILIAGTYSGRLYFPIIGRTRLTLIYLALIPLIISVSANTVNQLDVLNGIMPGTSIIILVGAIISSIILNAELAWIMIFPIMGALLGYISYNKHPAKVFSGDTGSLCVGGALGAIAIIGRLEFVILTAIMPHVINSFAILSTIRRLKERRQMARPTKMLEDGRLSATTTREAPITLVRLILAMGPLKETQIIKSIVFLVIFSTGLSIIAALLIPGGY